MSTLAIKQILDGEDDLTPDRLADEDKFTSEIGDWLRDQSERIADNTFNGEVPDENFWQAELALLVTFLGLFLIRWAEQGVTNAAIRLEQVRLGVGDQVNAEAERWANRHALRLARGLNKTTRDAAKQRIAVWFRSGANRDALVDSLNEIISPRWRAEMIAQTEITRALGEASRIVAKRTPGVETMVWWTRRDERVCPICAPLHGKRVGKDGTFNGFRSPPAHPRCRCDVTFEVKRR